MFVKFIAEDGLELKSVRIFGAQLRAFAHSLEHESHGGAEWEELDDGATQDLMGLFEELGSLVDNEADKEAAIEERSRRREAAAEEAAAGP